MLDDLLAALMGGSQQPGLMDLDSIMASQGSTNPIPYPMQGMAAPAPASPPAPPAAPQTPFGQGSLAPFGQGGAVPYLGGTPNVNPDDVTQGMALPETIGKSMAMPGLMPQAQPATPAQAPQDVSAQRAMPARAAQSGGNPFSGLFGSGDGSGAGPNFGDIMGAIGSGLMVASGDPTYVRYGLAQAGAMRKTAEARKVQSETAKYIKSRGIDASTAAFISRDPELMRSWFKSQQPDWKLQEVYDNDGRPFKVMMDMHSGQTFAVGGSKTDVLSPAAEQQKVRIAQAGRTQINNNLAGENAYSKEIGKQFADMNMNLIKGAASARSTMARLDRMKQLFADPNVYTGTGGEAVLALKRAAKSMGLNADNLSSAETIQAIGNEMALELRNPAGGAGMPGALSDSDREFLKSMSPGLGKTREGNLAMLDYRSRLAQRSLDVERMRQQYVQKNGRLDEGFFRELAQFSDANPLFPEAAQAAPASGAPAAPAGGNNIPPPPPGFKVVR